LLEHIMTGANSAHKGNHVIQMALPPIITYTGAAGTKTGTPATEPLKQTNSGPDTTSAGVSASGTPKQAVPTVDNQRGRQNDRVDADDRGRSRSKTRRAAEEKQMAEQAAAAEEAQAAELLAEAEALAAAEAGGTQDPFTKPSQKTRNSDTDEQPAEDVSMQQSAETA
jgi:hypothetical protein